MEIEVVNDAANEGMRVQWHFLIAAIVYVDSSVNLKCWSEWPKTCILRNTFDWVAVVMIIQRDARYSSYGSLVGGWFDDATRETRAGALVAC